MTSTPGLGQILFCCRWTETVFTLKPVWLQTTPGIHNHIQNSNTDTSASGELISNIYSSVSLSLLEPSHVHHNIMPFGCQITGLHLPWSDYTWKVSFWRIFRISYDAKTYPKQNLLKNWLSSEPIKAK